VTGLDLPTERSCSFCAYLDGTRSYTILDRTEHVAILVTREQRGVGHVLVIPAQHVPSILQVDQALGGALMHGIVRAATAVESLDGVAGISVWQNNGIAAEQTIGHVHFHVAGVRQGQETTRGPVPELSVDETDAIAAELRPGLPPV